MARSWRKGPRRAIAVVVAGLAVLVGSGAVVAASRALVVQDGSVPEFVLAAARVQNALILQGLTVDVTTDVPADLGPYCCVWDLRPFHVLSAAERASYLASLQAGHGLALFGEHPICCRSRNASIQVFLADKTLAGNVKIYTSEDIRGTSVEEANPAHAVNQSPNPIAQVTWDGAAAGVFEAFGSGTHLTTRGVFPNKVSAVWDEGTMGAAPGGRVVVTLDANWLIETFSQTDNEEFLENIAAFLCPFAPGGLLVDITSPATFLLECPASVTVVGAVDGLPTGCKHPTTLQAAEPVAAEMAGPTALNITSIEVSVNGGPFMPVASTSPGLPAVPPVSFNSGPLPLVLGSSTIVVEALDDGGRKASAAVTGALRDTRPPVIDPATCGDEILDLGPGCILDYSAVPAATDLCDALVTIVATPTLPITFTGPGTERVSYEARDDSGNTDGCSRTVTARDMSAPVLACAPPSTVECTTVAGTPASDPAIQAFLAATTAVDNCALASLTHDAPAVFGSGCRPGLATSVIWTALDPSRNKATCSADLRVEDSTPPAFTGKPGALALECSVMGGLPVSDAQVQTFLAAFQGSDACSTTVPATNDAPSLLPAGCAPGKLTRVTATLADDCGNEAKESGTITVVDSTPPALGVPPPISLECSGPGGVPIGHGTIQGWLGAALASDVCGTASLAHDAPLLFASGCDPGTTNPVTFTATDGCGLTTSLGTTVTVKDTTAPSLSVPGPLVLECKGPGGVSKSDPAVEAWLASAAASDVCGTAKLANNAPALFPSGCGAGATTTVAFTASDNCGNAVTLTSTITVKDTTPPSLSVPASLTLECNGSGGVSKSDPAIRAWLAAAAASDLCDGATIADNAPALFPSACGAGATTTVTFIAVDNCGNSVTKAASVTVRDTTAPVLSLPAPTVLECNSPGGVPSTDPQLAAWLASATASDVCDGATITHDAPPLFPTGCLPGATTAVTFTALDGCGNATTKASTVTVKDSTPPVIVGIGFDGDCLWPPNHNFDCIDDVAGDVTAADVCDPDAPEIHVLSCRSSQPEDDRGDGEFSPDCVIVSGGKGVCVRSERQGGGPEGRTYTIEVGARDRCGNQASREAKIHVPHDRWPKLACRKPNSGKHRKPQ